MGDLAGANPLVAHPCEQRGRWHVEFACQIAEQPLMRVPGQVGGILLFVGATVQPLACQQRCDHGPEKVLRRFAGRQCSVLSWWAISGQASPRACSATTRVRSYG
jgi:hypothetical protein